MDILRTAQESIRLQAEMVAKQANHVGADFESVVREIAAMKGRVVITGIGKSAIIAQKLVATLNSTGTASVFMHAGDAIHGDLGNVQREDLVIFISKSGSSPEIKVLVPLVKSMGNKLVGMVGNTESYLAAQSDFVLNTSVDREACPHNLAPTTSTSAQLAMGDAMAICIMELKGFKASDFARYHPGGALGKKLYLRAGELTDSSRTPQVEPGAGISALIVEISAKRLGATAVVEGGKLVGIVTDGDLRRMLEKTPSFSHLQAKDIMTTGAKTIDYDALAVEAFELMERHKITQLPVLREGNYAGFIHLHDILKEGIY
jgi:arabinose-5-phosphate isomerase